MLLASGLLIKLLDPNSKNAWIIFPTYAVCVWMLVLIVVGYTSGWRALAQQYRLETSFAGEILKWQSGEMRWTNFNSCLKIGAAASGLYLGVMPPFHFFTPPLLVPWNEVSISRRKRFLFEGVRLELGRDLKIPLWIRLKLANRLRAAVPNWPVETIG
jgi:hypothetical protein